MLRIVDNIGHGTGFNDFTVIHHRHTVAYISDHGEVMTDEEKSQIVRGAQLLEQFGNFGLNGYIQCENRLTGHSKPGSFGIMLQLREVATHAGLCFLYTERISCLMRIDEQ